MSAAASSAPVAKGTFLKRAVILYHQGRYPRMEEELRKELAEDPDDAQTLAWLALALLKLGRSDDAVGVVQDAIRLQPESAFAHYARARVLYEQGRRRAVGDRVYAIIRGRATPETSHHQAEAEDAVREAMRVAPEDPDLFYLLADIRIEQGRGEEALTAAEDGLRIAPRHVGLLQQRADVLRKLGRRDEAREAFQAALAANPENAWTHKEYGELLLVMGAAGPALGHLREALRLAPEVEADVRPMIAQAMREKFRLYRWVISGNNLAYLVYAFVALMVLVTWWAYRTEWRPAVVATRVLGSFTLPLVLAGLFFVVDPVLNLSIARTPFGRLVLSHEERRMALLVGGCLLLSAAGAVLWLILGKDVYVFAAVFAFMWVCPLGFTAELPWGLLRRVGWISTAAAAAITAGSLAPFFLVSDDETWARVWPIVYAVIGVGYFFLLVPFALSRAAGEYGYFTPTARRRAVVVYWCLQLLALLVTLGADFSRPFLSESARPAARQVSTAAAVSLGLMCLAPVWVIDRLEKVVRRVWK